MPELPEVETIRAQLAPRLEGRTFARVEILDPRLTRPHDLFEVAEELEGDRVVAVERRGKYLLVRLESGLGLLVHLRMTGSFGFAPVSHERAVIELDDGGRLGYRDVRRFGTWLVLDGVELEPYLAAKNGPEPLGLALHGRLARARNSRGGKRHSRRCSSTSGSSRGSGTSTRTRRSGARGSTRCGPRTGCLPRRSPGSRARSAQLYAPGSSARVRRCATTPRQTALPARCRTSSACTAATGSRVGAAARRSRRRASAVAEPGSARAANRSMQGADTGPT